MIILRFIAWLLSCGEYDPYDPKENSLMAVPTYSFEAVPATGSADFEPFVLDVPSLSGHDFAARCAWWTVFHALGPRGIEPEEFAVYEFDGDERGRRVTMGGFIVS